MRIVFARRKVFTVVTSTLVVGIVTFVGAAWRGSAHGATITASYESGHLDVSINGYGTSGMGTFRLGDAGIGHVALCVEANERHSTDTDAYSPVENRLVSAELDSLVWLVSQMPMVDPDTGVAAAALAWFYSGAQRNIGVPVWADGNRDFAAMSPAEPERWDALAPYQLSHLIGLSAEGVDLDTAERRVFELYEASARLAGPWTLSQVNGRFRLAGPAGGIGGHTVTVTVRDHTGSPTTTIDLVTDADGWVSPSVAAMPSGGSVMATTTGPGVHREWDGSGDIQRLVTAVDMPVFAEYSVPAAPGHLLVVKQATDPTIAVSGATFALLDGNSAEFERVTTGTSGEARFAPVDPAAHGGPYIVREISAPPGLLRSAPDQSVPSLSADLDAPTTIIMTDAPRTVPIQIQKRLSVDDVGPPDKSGFDFVVVRLDDGLATRVVTDETGVSQTIELALGEYSVCEQGVPAWAGSLVDGGCVGLAITIELLDQYDAAIDQYPALRPPFAVEYINEVVAPSISTRATDHADGDRLLEATGGLVVDVVTLSGLIPGTAYVISGELVPPGASSTNVSDAEGTTSQSDTARSTAHTEFTATAEDEEHVVTFDVPALDAGRYVIVERLWVSSRLVAEHADFADEMQTIEILPPVTTTAATSTIPTTTAPVTTITVPAVATTTSSTTTPPTTSTTLAETTTTVQPVPPITKPPSPPTLPTTGVAGTDHLLRLGDIALVVGLGLVAMTRLIPRRAQRS